MERRDKLRIVAAFAIAIAIFTWLFCDRVEAQSAGTIHATSPPATSAPDAVSISNHSWSGEIDDARAGRGSIAIRFSSDGGTFVASFCCNMSNTGTIINFVQTSDQHATFVLHSSLFAGCDYSVTSFAADGQLKGSYQGCGNNSGSFDLVSNDLVPQIAQRAQSSTEPPSSPSPTPDATYAQAKPAKLRSNSASKRLCILTGTVKWDRTPRGIISDVELGAQVVEGPLKGARVTIIGGGATRQVETDAHGAFRIAAPVGPFTFEVQASGYVPERIPLTMDPSSFQITFATDPYQGSLNGDGIGISGVMRGSVCAEMDVELVPSRAPSAAEKAQIARIQQAQIARFQQAHPQIARIARSLKAVSLEATATAFPHVAERTWYSNLEAFNTTAASSGLSCQTMIRQANTMTSIPQLSSPRMFLVLATDAALCLRAVRVETPDGLPARIPKYYLVGACRITRATHENDGGYCAGVPVK